MFLRSFLAIGLAPLLTNAYLSGSVGPTTSVATKSATKTCNVLDYGAVADKTHDIGPALSSAWVACRDGGVVYVPPGDYGFSTWVTLSSGQNSAIQLDGIIYRTGTDEGNMIMIKHSTDFELFSSTSKGAIQGLGYEFHTSGSAGGPRILRLYDVTDFSVHDLALVDAPAFHFSLDTCVNGEVYNMAIRGGNLGGLDGIDVWSTNLWIHDVEVTNKDECVTVKSPAQNILVENVYCNWSGGCAMGSLGTDVNITDITYRNIYTWSSNQMYMIKSNGGSGNVDNLLLENFIGHGNAYSLDIDGAWSSMSTVAGDGVQLTNVTVRNWKGTESNGAERGPVKVKCAAKAPCKDVTIEDFAMWTETGSYQANTCESAYGSGSCIKDSEDYVSYTTTVTESSAPTGYSAATMASDLTEAFGTASSIPIPTIPTSFYPGATPYSALAGADSVATNVKVPAAASSVAVASSSVSSTVVATPSSTNVGVEAISASSSIAVVSSTASSTSAAAIETSLGGVEVIGTASSVALASSTVFSTFAAATETSLGGVEAMGTASSIAVLSSPVSSVPAVASSSFEAIDTASSIAVLSSPVSSASATATETSLADVETVGTASSTPIATTPAPIAIPTAPESAYSAPTTLVKVKGTCPLVHKENGGHGHGHGPRV